MKIPVWQSWLTICGVVAVAVLQVMEIAYMCTLGEHTPAAVAPLAAAIVEPGREGLLDEVSAVASISAPEFHRRFLMKSRPMIVRGGAANWTAVSAWTNEYLLDTIGKDRHVRIETSSCGIFASFMPDFSREVARFSSFMERLDAPGTHVYYAEGELYGLAADVEAPSFTAGLELERLQLWLGAGGTQSLAHSDAFENVIVQVDGSKTMVLVPPTERIHVYADGGVAGVFGGHTVAVPSPYSPVDFFSPDLRLFPRFARARTYSVTLRAGDVMYLPAFWWHHVRNNGPGGTGSIAVNWWFAPHALLDVLFGAIEDSGTP